MCSIHQGIKCLFKGETCKVEIEPISISCWYPALRRANNWNQATAQQWQKLAAAVEYSYQGYDRALAYLRDLVNNRNWTDSNLAPLPWHDQPAGALQQAPPFAMHQAVLNALAPSVPLRAVFSRG